MSLVEKGEVVHFKYLRRYQNPARLTDATRDGRVKSERGCEREGRDKDRGMVGIGREAAKAERKQF